MNGKYRLNAGAIVFNREGKVLIFARADFDGQWQFPQGGIEAGEKPQAAALRELKEETNICSVIPAAAYPEPLRYDFPPQILEKFQKLGRSNIGQEQYWFLFYFIRSAKRKLISERIPKKLNSKITNGLKLKRFRIWS